jgi:hypothetical protein
VRLPIVAPNEPPPATRIIAADMPHDTVAARGLASDASSDAPGSTGLDRRHQRRRCLDTL